MVTRGQSDKNKIKKAYSLHELFSLNICYKIDYQSNHILNFRNPFVPCNEAYLDFY
jgi:hypothetical protein